MGIGAKITKGHMHANILSKAYLVHGLCVALLFALTALAFFAGRDGPWLLDDKHNIVNLQNLQPAFVEQQPLWRTAQVNNEWHKRSLARLSFALTVKTCGLTPACFKTTNMVLQALTAIVLYFLSLQLLHFARRSFAEQFSFGQQAAPEKHRFDFALALCVAAVWAVHPIQVSTVLYAVQRMAMLATFFSLLAMLGWLQWRKAPGCWTARLYLVLAGLAAVCAWFCKENAVVLPLLILCVEIFILRPQLEFTKNPVMLVAIIVLLAGGLFAGLHLLSTESFFEDFNSRPFSPWERLLTEFRVLWLYLYWIILPTTSHYTLFHDDILISAGLLQPWTTLLALFALVGVSVALFYARIIVPLLAFGWFWFLAAHSVESTFLGLELVFEHRNHLPMTGLLFGVFATVAIGLKKIYLLKDFAQRQWLVYLLPVFALAYCTLVAAEKSYHWRSDGSMLVYESQFHPRSVRLNYKIAFLWLQLGNTPGLTATQRQDYLKLAEAAYRTAHAANSHNLHGTIGLLYMQGQHLLAQEEGFWPQLYLRLQTAPMSADGANLLQVLNDCYLERRCNFAKDKLQRAYELYLSRPVKDAAKYNAQQALLRLQATNS